MFIQQQNIFFSRMKRPSDNSSRRLIPVQIWELLHTFKYFSEIEKFKTFFFVLFTFIFFKFKTLLLDLTMKKQPKNRREKTQA